MKYLRYVILGGGVAAGNAAQAFAEAGGKPGELAIVSADNAPPYDRPPLSKDFLAGEMEEEKVFIAPRTFYDEHGITLLLDTEVTAVDTQRRILQVSRGDAIQFERLLIATGGKVRELKAEGAREAGVQYLRSLDDARGLIRAAEANASAAVIGDGFIATEVAASLRGRGCEVTMIFPAAQLMPRLYTDKMAAFFTRYYERQGVKLLPGERVTAVSRNAEGLRLTLSSGKEVVVDFAVAGVGVDPVVALFTPTDLKTENGVCVDERLETNVPGIFAAGDVANYEDLRYGKRRRVEHWQNAVDQGQLAMRNMLGGSETYNNVPYYFSDVFDLSWEFWGDAAQTDEVLHVGDFESGAFSVWWLREGVVEAAFVMGRPDEERDQAQQCVEQALQVPDAIRSKAL